MVSFPGSIPSLPRPTSSTTMDASGYEGDVVVDLISDEVEAIATELGTDPAGAAATVKERLEYGERFGAPNGAMWPSGAWISTAQNASAATTVARLANTQYYSPWWCPMSVTLDRIAVQVTTLQASANARIGIYSSGTDGGPGSLLVDAGEIDCSTTGVKTLTISQAVVGATYYWLSMANETASVSYQAVATTGARTFGVVPDTTYTYAPSQFSEDETYPASLQSTAAAYASLTALGSAPPIFWLRRT